MAYITTEEVKAIRQALKAEFGKTFKFSVTKQNYSQVTVSVMASPLAFTEQLNGRDNAEINHYWIEDNEKLSSEEKKVAEKINQIILTAPAKLTGEAFRDNSDSMTDYCDVSYYFHISLGKWDKPYVQTATKAEAA